MLTRRFTSLIAATVTGMLGLTFIVGAGLIPAGAVGTPVSPDESGQVIQVGTSAFLNQLTVPVLPSGLSYTAVSAGTYHVVLLRSDGTAVASGYNADGQLDVPALPSGVTYAAVSAGSAHTLLLRSDGTVVAFGRNNWGELNIPALPSGVTYTAIAAGRSHSVLLRSDGNVVAVGENAQNALNVPALPAGVTYTAVAAGEEFTVLLRSDGEAVGFGSNTFGKAEVPALPAGLTYTDVSAGWDHAVYLRSDGSAIAVGEDYEGQLDVPTLPSGVTYTAVAAGEYHTILLRSDGTAVAFGENGEGRTDLPAPATGLAFTAIAGGGWRSYVLQSAASVTFDANDGSGTMTAVKSGSMLPSATFTRSGHDFTGWNTSADGTGTDYADGAPVSYSTSALTLYAQWERHPITRIEISGPTSVTERTAAVFTVEGFDSANSSVGDVTDEATLTAPDAAVAGASVTFPFDPAFLGDTRVETVAAALTDDATIDDDVLIDVDPVAVDLRVIAPATADQGDTITVQVEALDSSEETLADVTDHVILTSDVASDEIAGDTVTFPTASLHTITATADSGLSASAVVKVTPTPAVVVPPAKPTAPSVLGATGADVLPVAAGAMLQLAAGLLLLVRRRRRGARLES